MSGRWRVMACGVVAAVLLGGLTACRAPRGPSFDPYSGAATPLTNLVAVPSTNGISPSMLRPSTEPVRLGPGDRFEIEVLGEDGGSQMAIVGPDGKIYFQLLPGLQVWGLTLAEAKALLERELGAYVRSPQVGVTLRVIESRRVWVMGRINTPGIYPLEAPMTVIEAIAKAGGLFTSRFTGTTEELADLHHSFIVRRGQYLPVNFHQLIREGDTSQNIYLEPDDFIYLPSSLSSEVYVLGAVFQPRTVGFKDQVTLVSAIASARGSIAGAHTESVAIVRGSLVTPQIAIVNFNDIVRGLKPDIRLEPHDIVYVPPQAFFSLRRYADLIVNTFVRTVAANEGGHAADPTFKPVIPVGGGG